MSLRTRLLDYAASRFAQLYPRHDKPARSRLKPFNDPGGYAAYGDWPLVPSDLEILRRFHSERNTL
jgi:hypothetical protein